MTTQREGTVRIGCAAGFWGDSRSAARDLVDQGELDYLVFDYLAEITMSILARARVKDASQGYARDFVTVAAEVMAKCIARGTKVISNAGGVNPLGCRDALQAELDARGVTARIAVVLGDDLLDRASDLRDRGAVDMFTGQKLPEDVVSVNAYLGAEPIARALDDGADVVITGRCVDSAVVLGPLIHEFGWPMDDYDRLAGASLLGHLVECGPMVTGGLHTDWQEVAGWEDISFPIVECHADGSGVITKLPNKGGAITPAIVSEQIVYEIGDPSCYVLPDVVCDWTAVELAMDGVDRVLVRGARGHEPTASYKVSATYADGFRATTTLTLVGSKATDKARAVARMISTRCERLLSERGFSPFDRFDAEVLGSEAMYGPSGRSDSREVVLKIAVSHAERSAVSIFAAEIAPALTATAPGITGFFAGRPAPVAIVRLTSFLLPKDEVTVSVDAGGVSRELSVAKGADRQRGNPRVGVQAEPVVRLPISRLAYGRSGDKGDIANIGLIAREPVYVDVLRRMVTEELVARTFGHLVRGTVTRFELPGISAFNFVLTEALDGGGVASLRMDPQAKAYASILLDVEIDVPLASAKAVGLLVSP
jgi:hypothetical protein